MFYLIKYKNIRHAFGDIFFPFTHTFFERYAQLDTCDATCGTTTTIFYTD